MAVSIVFVFLSGGDNRAELQRILRTFLTCVCLIPLIVQLWFYFPESQDAPGRRLAALPRRLFPCNDFHGSCSPDQSRSKRVCDAAYLGIKPNNELEQSSHE